MPLDLGVVLAQHCEVARLTEGAVMHEGALLLALSACPGWPSIAEELMVHRDIELARLTGATVHLHLSTAQASTSSAAAKADGLAVTAEATPHHLSLTDELLAGFDVAVQGQPAAAHDAPTSMPCGAGLADGTIDAIATDHAPHRAPRTRSSRSTRRRPGCSGSRPRSAWRWPHLDMPLAACWRRCRGSRRRSPGSATAMASRSRSAKPANLIVFDPNVGVGGAAGPAGEQEPQHTVRRRGAAGSGRHTVLRRPARRRSAGAAWRNHEYLMQCMV